MRSGVSSNKIIIIIIIIVITKRQLLVVGVLPIVVHRHKLPQRVAGENAPQSGIVLLLQQPDGQRLGGETLEGDVRERLQLVGEEEGEEVGRDPGVSQTPALGDRGEVTGRVVGGTDAGVEVGAVVHH